MIRTLSAALLCAAASIGTAQAQGLGDAEFGVSLGASTLGLTVEPSVRLNDRWGLRVPIGAMSFDLEDESNGEEYTGDVDSAGLGLLADWYPVSGRGFRLSAGAFYTDYKADLWADDVELSGYVADVEARIRQKNRFLPAIAVGYDGKLGERGLLSLTVGGMFGNEFEVDGRESTGLVPQDIVDNEIREIRDELDDFDIIPYIQLSVGFRF